MDFHFLLVAALLLLGSAPAMARPEYAAKEKLQCTACHATPWGGGPRTVFGKGYGARGLGTSITSLSDLYYGDLRFVSYYPLDETAKRLNGTTSMEAAAAVHVPVYRNDDSGTAMGALASYNIAPLSGANLREAYARFKLGGGGATESDVVLGRFYVPFGLLTDEHRTYTRLQTNSMLNNFQVGAAFSRNVGDWHLDLAGVNDLQGGGNFNGTDITWAGVINARWNPVGAPILLGTSFNYERFLNQPDPYAGSIYLVLSLDRLSENAVSGSLSLEGVLAKNWNNPAINTGGINPGLPTFFIPPAEGAYQRELAGEGSFGTYALAKYNLSQQWTLIYKLDYLALDAGQLNRNYTRHGLGFEVFLNTNLILNTRFELASTPNQGIDDSAVLAAQDDLYLMLRLWI